MKASCWVCCIDCIPNLQTHRCGRASTTMAQLATQPSATVPSSPLADRSSSAILFKETTRVACRQTSKRQGGKCPVKTRTCRIFAINACQKCQQTRAQRNPKVTTQTSVGSVKVAIRECPPSGSGPKAPKASDPSVQTKAENGVARMCLARKVPHRSERVASGGTTRNWIPALTKEGLSRRLTRRRRSGAKPW